MGRHLEILDAMCESVWDIESVDVDCDTAKRTRSYVFTFKLATEIDDLHNVLSSR